MGLDHWLETADRLLWGPGTLGLLLGTGLLLTLRTRFLPWRNLSWALRTALGREARQTGRDGVSPFASLMTALAATVGTGNIVGVATALVAGGPGALVWMELAAVIGLATKYTECMLAAKYRCRDPRGNWRGGPMYVMQAALGRPGAWMGSLFALAAVAAAFCAGAMVQSNSLAEAMEGAFALPARVTGPGAAGLALLVMLGGVRGISRVSSALVPVMALFYAAAGLAVIGGNLGNLPASLAEIFRGALCPRAAAGGAAGAAFSQLEALRWGVARGAFSNEAGVGSAAIAAAAASGDSPVRQGYISMTSNVIDTLVICTVTGLAICCSGVLGTTDAAGVPVDGGALTILAFQTVLGTAGAKAVAAAVVLFAFSSILGWAYQGEAAFVYLFGDRLLPLFRLSYLLAVLLGAPAPLEAVFGLADLCNALMCLPNLLCLLLLSGMAARETLAFQGAAVRLPAVQRGRL